MKKRKWYYRNRLIILLFLTIFGIPLSLLLLSFRSSLRLWLKILITLAVILCAFGIFNFIKETPLVKDLLPGCRELSEEIETYLKNKKPNETDALGSADKNLLKNIPPQELDNILHYISETNPIKNKNISQIYAKQKNAVITVLTLDAFNKPLLQGSGFIISPSGLICTNYHVIEGAYEIIVILSDNQWLPGVQVVGFDKADDLSLLKMTLLKMNEKNFPTVKLGNSDEIMVGEKIVAIGSPLGFKETLSEGIISGPVRDLEKEGKALQISVSISEGSSGGPVYNLAGEVIGISTFFFEEGQNLNFAIPINQLRKLIVRSLEENP